MLNPTVPPVVSSSDFEARLLHFINKILPSFDRRGRAWSPVSADTLLFATGVLDSLSILHLIAAIEDLTGRAVPDHLVVMKHFQSVEAITAVFSKPTLNDQP
jgi:acyl carrier protein